MNTYKYVFTVCELYIAKRSLITLYDCRTAEEAAKIRRQTNDHHDFDDEFYFEFSNPIDYNRGWQQAIEACEFKAEVCHAF